MTLSRPRVHELLETHGLAARRKRGQNFVADPNTVRKIAGVASLGPGDLAIEVGPGLGSLTLALVETGATVRAIEIDEGLADVARTIVGDTATIISGDACTVDWNDLIGSHEGRVVLVSNLPYNVGTTIILDVLLQVPQISELVVMVQAEVADRLVAIPGRREYGIPSVFVASCASASIVAKVPPSVFVPKPKVESSVVHIIRDDPPQVANVDGSFSDLVRTGFAQRRKMIRKSLGDMVSIEQIERANVAPTARPEELSISDWISLSRVAEQAN